MKIVAFLILALVNISQAQPGSDPLLSYLGIEASPDDRRQLKQLQAQVEATTSPQADRLVAFHQLLHAYARHLGMDTTSLGKAIQSWGTRQTIGRNLSVFEDLSYPVTPAGALAEVRKFGSGSIPVLLIPEYRKNWSMYEEFIQSNLSAFTFYAITLPGYNGTNAYALPPRYDFSNRVWLDNVVAGAMELISREKLNKPIVMGALNAGSYIGVQLVSRLKDNTRGLILLNGSIREGSDPVSYNRTPEERAQVTNRDFSNVIWYLLRRYSYSDTELQTMMKRKLLPGHPIFYYTKDTVKVKPVYRMHNAFRSLMERYDLEWQTADLSGPLNSMRAPLLVILSDYDAAWPFGSTTNALIEQWKKFKVDSRKDNLTISEVQNARLILTIERPDAVSRLLKAFAAKEEIPARIE